ncbi:MAG TPA: tetratricopeptide repeat protein [Candidatus Eremiobacteraceae bacterium]|nr:tetratricopeptide repeat protein [Candidatus Eremiobacteraceae bacterium]
MSRSKILHLVLTASLLLISVGLTACNQTSGNVSTAAADSGKLPITTRSEEARQEFLQGQDLSDRLLGQESLQHFDKALSLDPEFASAELARANNSATAKDFFDHLKKAVTLDDKTSEGEKLLILANEAGANGDTEKQKNYLEKLAAAYPNDERVQFNLGTYYFGQQELDDAVAHFKKATEIAPNYSPTYNQLGYAYRQQEDFSSAEQAFKKYVELIPNDPNPYDSYAELLLKMGRFEDSQVQYRKALTVDPHFQPSHFGLAAALLYAGKAEDAQGELQKMADKARNDGELRTAYFGMAVMESDAGRFDKALQVMDKEYAVAQKTNDVASMAADLQAEGNILAEIPRYDEAQRRFDRSFQMIQASSLSQEIKDNAKLQHELNLATIAAGQKDFAAAKAHAEDFRKGAEATKNSVQIRQSHGLAGRIALGEKDYATAIAELEQANLQNPDNLYRLSQAYQAKGDAAKAQDYLTKAANFNCVPALNYAFVRVKARKLAAEKKAS